MDERGLRAAYERYLACLNGRELDRLHEHVGEDVQHNGRRLGLPGYRRMLEGDFARIPDLTFGLDLLVAERDRVAARLVFDCTPGGELFGVPVDGVRVTFCEHVFYRYVDGRIAEVHSLLDADAVRAQLPAAGRGAT
ncbi:ester cyclase [uncultured Pseudokineococcus sp.]|uniref:ester cyclase n=1 Tax=uncultured Pseudokineococcus sp. TaxID=1642928 RepID=UPI00262F1B41|nr:ester cyclase [uncultured Pseudokineococcus sp.]